MPLLPDSSLLALSAALESIWLGQWAFVFNDTPFNTASTISLESKKILKSQHEELLHSGIPHSPPPIFSEDSLYSLNWVASSDQGVLKAEVLSIMLATSELGEVITNTDDK
ncbi:uncharacterized protein EV154DRAFT_559852 [Mucor mucedo]|uniref:uncharacterized protein n=1 Tax=Mucor mucedo TaxID=29922 RepID=UPI00222060FE|nr:uncharacterized protein EV154DRAFT_559852 [Mucor mucedo]KAI7895107.1 hypothetical protein EV154DRAFT_559852 [Mucor mucedo]